MRRFCQIQHPPASTTALSAIRSSIEAFGRDRMVSDLNGADFDDLRAKLAKRLGPIRLTNEVQRVRSVFKFALADGLIDRAVLFGAAFVRPPKRMIRLNRANRAPKMFTAEQCRLLIDNASLKMKAFILLGLNGGFVSRDCGTLPGKAVDLEGLSFPGLSPLRDALLDADLRRAPTTTAGRLYTGVLYAALAIDTLPARTASNIVISSAPFGALRPGDRVPAYRRELDAA